MPIPTIRPATEPDLPALRRLLAETWHATYNALLGPDHVTEITDAWHAIPVLRGQIDQSGSAFLVAEQNGMLVGHVHTREEPGGLVYLGRLYVHPGHQRHGTGRRLPRTALDRHPTATRVWLRVAAENTQAVAFYHREGFAIVNETTDRKGLRELRMERDLRAWPSCSGTGPDDPQGVTWLTPSP